MYDSTGNNPSHRNSNKRLKERFGSHTRKTLNSFTIKHSCTWNITHNTEVSAVRNLEPQQWGSELIQRHTRKRRPVKINTIIIIIIIIMQKLKTNAENLS